MFEAVIYVLDGRGATTVWQSSGPRQSFEWQTGSLFAIPLNAGYQHFNGQGDREARLLAVTTAPLIFNLFRSEDFVLNNRTHLRTGSVVKRVTSAAFEAEYAKLGAEVKMPKFR